MQKIILFDFDGTLIDSQLSIINGFNHAFLEHKFNSPDEISVVNLIGYPLDIMFSRLGIPDELLENFIHSYKKYYQKNYLSQTKLFKFSKEALELASSFATLGIVTTKTSLSTQILLKHFEISHFFQAVIGKDDVTKPKPDKEPILKALKQLNSNGKKSFMIGDTNLDCIAAKSANITPVGVTCGYGDKDSLRENCDHIFENTLEAVKFIKNYNW